MKVVDLWQNIDFFFFLLWCSFIVPIEIIVAHLCYSTNTLNYLMILEGSNPTLMKIMAKYETSINQSQNVGKITSIIYFVYNLK